MPKYIELDEAIRTANGFIHNQIDACDMAFALEEKSIEDVVPRSEVEGYIVNMNAYGLTAKRLAEENEGLKKENEILSANNKTLAYSRTRIEAELIKAKQEVAREIVNEIRKFRDKLSSNTAQYEIMSLIFALEKKYKLKKKYIGE